MLGALPVLSLALNHPCNHQCIRSASQAAWRHFLAKADAGSLGRTCADWRQRSARRAQALHDYVQLVEQGEPMLSTIAWLRPVASIAYSNTTGRAVIATHIHMQALPASDLVPCASAEALYT